MEHGRDRWSRTKQVCCPRRHQLFLILMPIMPHKIHTAHPLAGCVLAISSHTNLNKWREQVEPRARTPWLACAWRAIMHGLTGGETIMVSQPSTPANSGRCVCVIVSRSQLEPRGAQPSTDTLLVAAAPCIIWALFFGGSRDACGAARRERSANASSGRELRSSNRCCCFKGCCC